MKYLKLFEGFEDIDAICQKYGITNYTINSDGSIDVDGSLNWKKLDKLPVKFNRVSRHFYCQYNQLISLEGAPKIVEGDFYCSRNQLTSLKGSPKWVGRNFYCNNNKLTSLEGAPKWVGGTFYCKFNPLPKLIKDNERYIKEIIKWQDEYNIWRNGNLDEFRFREMMIDIKNEVDQ